MTEEPTKNYRPAATDMVSIVNNTIDGYRMGPLRALAQEPVQNSKDAALTKNQKVTVVFELHDRFLYGETIGHMLTVTDSGTRGLGGPMLDPATLSSMGSVLEPGHDWTAFEGQGYTKRDQDALGSRGQGKSAFLYHSRPPDSSAGSRRMVILYDTLLPNGEYRLGVRYANPSDVTMTPPYVGGQAKSAIAATSFVFDEGLEFPVALEPLTEPGTRVIIPFLDPSTREAVTSGQLEKWLQMSWWRPIQLGQLRIIVKAGGLCKQISVPSWWVGEPWKEYDNVGEMYYKEDIRLPDTPEMRIKRLALRCSDDIPEHVPLYSTKEPEFDGIQLLRGGQWIETIGRSESWYISKVPTNLRSRFRGFVEFDRKLDRELRDSKYESPQHDDFKRTHKIVKDILEQVERCVTEFSEIAGWTEESDDPSRIQRKHRDVFNQVMELFTEPLPNGSQGPDGEDGDQTNWTVVLNADYPNPYSTRVDWGQSLDNVTATCTVSPVPTFSNAKFKLAVINPDGSTTPVNEVKAQIEDSGQATAKFGNIRFLKGKSASSLPYVGCEEPGRYRLRVTVESVERQTAKANRSIYVQTDPPEPPKRSLSLQVLAKNHLEPDRERINAGEDLQVGISLRNHAIGRKVLIVDASIVASEVPGHLIGGVDTPGAVQLLNAHEVAVEGVQRKGETAEPVSVFNDLVTLFDDMPKTPQTGLNIVLAPGAHKVQVDIRDTDGNPIESRSKRFWFETEPLSRKRGGLPFEVVSRADGFDTTGRADPDWRFEAGLTKLVYSTSHPLYIAAAKADIGSRRADPGTRAYLSNICSDALLDWMMVPFLDNGDESRFQAIESRRNIEPWEHLAELVESYRVLCDETNGNHPTDREQLRRTIVANMVRVFTEHH